MNKLCYQVTHNLPPAKEEISFYSADEKSCFPFQSRTWERSLTALPIANSSPWPCCHRAIHKPPKLERRLLYILVHLAILWNQALTPAVLPRPNMQTKPLQKISNAERICLFLALLRIIPCRRYFVLTNTGLLKKRHTTHFLSGQPP